MQKLKDLREELQEIHDTLLGRGKLDYVEVRRLKRLAFRIEETIEKLKRKEDAQEKT